MSKMSNKEFANFLDELETLIFENQSKYFIKSVSILYKNTKVQISYRDIREKNEHGSVTFSLNNKYPEDVFDEFMQYMHDKNVPESYFDNKLLKIIDL